ncbi:hypothetical protein ASG90_01130 [Nocardioides sp. Soil797]|nr:hypothetical protein ASG90_01130 [Nocardioides sp. Soil797]
MTAVQEAEVVKTRLTWLDAARFSAAGMVLGYHYTFRGNNGGKIEASWPTFIQDVTKYGYLGVDLFFIISGLVIGFSAIGRTPRAYLGSRLSRLLPAYVAAVMLTSSALVIFRPGWRDVPSWSEIVANLTMVPNLLGQAYIEPVYWTLWCELRFYAIVLILVLFRPTKKTLLTLAGIWNLAGWLWWAVHWSGHNMPAWDLVVQPYSGQYFVAGIAIALLMHKKERYFVAAPILLSACSLSALAAMNFARNTEAHHDVDLNMGVVVSVVIAFHVVVAVCTMLPPPASPKIAGAFTRLGALTYPLYLVHASIGYLIIGALVPSWGIVTATVVAAACAIAISFVIHRCIEEPVAPRLRKLISQGTLR